MKPFRSQLAHAEPPAAPLDATDPGVPPMEAMEGAGPAEALDPRSTTAGRAEPTIPDPMEVERLILSLERAPRPPAPVPDERAHSDGGRFVAYRSTGRPVPRQPPGTPDFGEEGPGERSVLVNATPIPPDARPSIRTTLRIAGRRTDRVSGWIWMAGAMFVGLGVFASVLLLSRPHAVGSSAAPVLRIAPRAPEPVGAGAPAVLFQITPRPPRSEPPTDPSGGLAARPSRPHAITVAASEGNPGAMPGLADSQAVGEAQGPEPTGGGAFPGAGAPTAAMPSGTPAARTSGAGASATAGSAATAGPAVGAALPKTTNPSATTATTQSAQPRRPIFGDW